MDVSCKIKMNFWHTIDQYGNYKVDDVDVYLNGINTQGENIADNGGIKQSFYVSKKLFLWYIDT